MIYTIKLMGQIFVLRHSMINRDSDNIREVFFKFEMMSCSFDPYYIYNKMYVVILKSLVSNKPGHYSNLSDNERNFDCIRTPEQPRALSQTGFNYRFLNQNFIIQSSFRLVSNQLSSIIIYLIYLILVDMWNFEVNLRTGLIPRYLTVLVEGINQPFVQTFGQD